MYSRAIILKRNILLFVFVLLISNIRAQNKTLGSNGVLFTHQQVFNNALELNDIETALQACHYIVALQGANSPYKDTMAILYHSIGKYRQSLLLGLSLLNQKASNATLLNIIADSYNKMGNVKDAINYQEKLFALMPLASVGFNLLEMQMQMQRNPEAIITGNQLLNTKIDSNMVFYYKDTTNKNLSTPLKAAIYNYLGTAFYKQGDKIRAKIMFTKALEIDDNFLIARLNMVALNKEEIKN